MKYFACVLLVALMLKSGQSVFIDCNTDSDCQVFECCTYDPRIFSEKSCKPRLVSPSDLITKRNEDGVEEQDLESDLETFFEAVESARGKGKITLIPCTRYRYCRDNDDCRGIEFCDIRFNLNTALFRQGICLED